MNTRTWDGIHLCQWDLKYYFPARKRDFKHGHQTDAGSQWLQGPQHIFFFIWENFKSLTGVSCEKLQDADADGHPLGWRRKKQHFELNELLLWFRVLRWRGRWLEDATFLSFWRHGATMPSFDVLLLLIFVQVNIAALMESTSEPMKIQISQTTQENFQFKKHD